MAAGAPWQGAFRWAAAVAIGASVAALYPQHAAAEGTPAAEAASVGGSASQQPPPAATYPAESSPPRDAPRHARQRRGPRKASTGFAAALGTGISFPFGDASGRSGDTLPQRYSWQVPIIVDLGVKITEAIYAGGYLHFGFGAEGSNTDIEEFCDDDDEDFENDIACTTLTIRLGLLARYQLAPSARWNPWVGYGVGIEGVIQTIGDRVRNREETTSSTGYTFAKLELGVDYRTVVGLGPFVEIAASRFHKSRTEINGDEVHSGPIDDRAWHVWTTLGVRMVFNP